MRSTEPSPLPALRLISRFWALPGQDRRATLAQRISGTPGLVVIVRFLGAQPHLEMLGGRGSRSEASGRRPGKRCPSFKPPQRVSHAIAVIHRDPCAPLTSGFKSPSADRGIQPATPACRRSLGQTPWPESFLTVPVVPEVGFLRSAPLILILTQGLDVRPLPLPAGPLNDSWCFSLYDPSTFFGATRAMGRKRGTFSPIFDCRRNPFRENRPGTRRSTLAIGPLQHGPLAAIARSPEGLARACGPFQDRHARAGFGRDPGVGPKRLRPFRTYFSDNQPSGLAAFLQPRPFQPGGRKQFSFKLRKGFFSLIRDVGASSPISKTRHLVPAVLVTKLGGENVSPRFVRKTAMPSTTSSSGPQAILLLQTRDGRLRVPNPSSWRPAEGNLANFPRVAPLGRENGVADHGADFPRCEGWTLLGSFPLERRFGDRTAGFRQPADRYRASESIGFMPDGAKHRLSTFP